MYTDLLSRMIQGCMTTRNTALSPIHQKNLLSCVDIPINKNQAAKVATDMKNASP